MRNKKQLVCLAALLSLGLASARAEEPSYKDHEGIFSLSGDAGYYTYGMDEVNNRYLKGREGSVSGGLGYGAAVKFGVTRHLAAKVGIDYLYADTASSRTIGGTKVNTRVELPATMVFLGGEYSFLSLPGADLKLIGGYTLVTIYNGKEKSDTLDMGSVSGQGSGAQLGAGVEFFLGRRFSLETDLAYNLARINGATFAGSPADPNSVNSNGSVDYSGLVAKLALTIYLVP